MGGQRQWRTKSVASHLPPLFYRSEAIVFLAGMDGQSLSIDNKGELDRKLKTMLRNRKRCLYLTGGPTWLKSNTTELK